MDKQVMIDKIYEAVTPSVFGEYRTGESADHVMIGDVFDWIEKNMKEENINDQGWKDTAINHLLNIWIKKREPLDKQSEDVILFIYNLINEL